MEIGLPRELENCRKRCLDLEERSKKAEERCLVLEKEITKWKSGFMLLHGRFEALETGKLRVEDEVRPLTKGHVDQHEWVSLAGMADKLIDLTEDQEEEDKVVQLMVENKALECEKKKAESEIEVWKGKVKELEGLLLRSGEQPLGGKLEGLTKELEIGMKEMSKARGISDELDVNTSSMHFQIENNVVGGEEKVDTAIRLSSTLNCIDKGIGDLSPSGTPIITSTCKRSTLIEGEQRDILCVRKFRYGSRVTKQLAFEEAGTCNKKIAPSTPVVARPASISVIDIDDSDGEPESAVPYTSSLDTLDDKLHIKEVSSKNHLKRKILELSEEEDMDGYKTSSHFTRTPRRKRASNIVTSDSESENDDNIPICKLITEPMQESNSDAHLKSYCDEEKIEESVSRRRRLMKVRKCEPEDESERSSSSPANLKTSESNCFKNEDPEDEKVEENASESEGDSLGGFIVGSSDESERVDDFEVDDDSVGADSSEKSEDSSKGDMNIGEIMFRIRRKRNQNTSWEFEAEMLASFGKDPEMCMKAVCALYRQQTAEEKDCKETIHFNQRGFSQCDAKRGTKLAEFLTDGDQTGELVKSVEELQAYDYKGVELCRTLATRYSKQLFDIYKNKEDPFFLPS